MNRLFIIRRLAALSVLPAFVVMCLPIASVAAEKPNTLSDAERKAGWKLLFDGATKAGWRGFHRDDWPGVWEVEEGAIKRVKGRTGGGDLITADRYDDFELVLEYRIAPGGNSGIKYPVLERPGRKGRGGLGYELQIVDDAYHGDAKNPTRTTGSLYDLIAPAATKVLRPAGEWNQLRLVHRARHIEHWLNGTKIVDFQRGSDDMKARIARSKYRDIKGFGEVTRGHLLLQDHGNEIAFRSIKLRPLPPKQ